MAQATENTKKETVKKNDGNELVEIELFKDNKDYKDDVFVAVNGESCIIKRGEKVKIKKKFARVLEQSRRQDTNTAKMMEEKADEFTKADK
jgi:hypothetical protein